MTVSVRRRAAKLRVRTDFTTAPPLEYLATNASARRAQSALPVDTPQPSHPQPQPPPPPPPPLPPTTAPPSSFAAVPVLSMDDIDDPSRAGTPFFNDQTEAHWVLRGGHPTRLAAARAVAASREQPSARIPDASAPSHTRPNRLTRTRVAARSPSAPVPARGAARRRPAPQRQTQPRDRRVQFHRSRRRAHRDEQHAYYDTEVDHHWRLPIGKPLRRCDIVHEDPDAHNNDDSLHWSVGTASESDVRVLRANAFQVDRSDRRGMPNAWRADDASIARPRDRTGQRIGNAGARWRGLMARKDLVDDRKADAYTLDTNGDLHDLSPRSSLDIEEAISLYSLDEPPSSSVRGWRSNHSLTYRARPVGRPRRIQVIGRQHCINDLTDIVDRSNEPCVSYDRQIFDPVSKLWTYVEASQPSSSPWTVGSPITCSVSGTEEGVSTCGRGGASGVTGNVSELGEREVGESRLEVSDGTEVNEDEPMRRQSSPRFVRESSLNEGRLAFEATRDLWLGYSRKSVNGPANLEAVIFASEMEDIVDKDMLRRGSHT